MIKLQDFARENGVTDRAIQKHLKTYAAELEGLFERNGPNGTWLSEEACDFLRSKMKRSPIVVSDGEITRKKEAAEAERDELKKENKALLMELKETYKQMATLEGAQARLEAAEATRLLLEESRDEYKAQAAQKALEASEASQKAAEAAQKAQELQEALKAAEEEKNALKADFEAYKSLPWYKKFLNKG